MDIASSTFAIVAALALLVTKVVDLIRNAIDENDQAPKWIWNVSAFVVGLLVALAYQVDLLESISRSPASSVVGQIITGLVIGGGSSAWHELLDALSGVAKRGRV